MATRYRLCFYCLKPGHVSSACKSDRRRKSPASKDSSAVVSVGTTTTERVQETPTVECKSSSVSMIYANLASEKRGRINRFQTIKARAFGDAGSGITVTCLLDTGAEAQPVKVEGFGGATHEHPSSQVVQLWLGRLDGSQNAERYPLEALTVPSLCHRIPVSKILTSEWEHLQFFDPVIDDESSDEVHVVIGIDYYYRFLGDAIRRGKPGDPVAVETVLGWIICGPVNPHPAPETVAAFNAVVELSVENLLRRFLEIEEMGVPFRSESDEVDPEKRFREGLSYDGTRYSVRLLWKNSWLPDNFAVAKRCLETLERRMAREPSRRDVHSSILHNYLVNGWAEEITSEGPHGRTWYLPHHVVSQQGPEAMKHRIVFVASVKFKGTSLKEQLDSGLKLQADLLGILLRFRRFRVALQSDLAKMFLQVGLFDEDRGVCRFLWRKDGLGGPIATYRLTRVCFSVACSPYVAMQVVNHHLREKRDCFGTVVDEIKAGMYVDDLVVSCDSIDEARDFAHRSSELLASGGFHLAKWANNAPEALVDLPAEEIFRDRYSCLWKNLGISWNPQEDELTFRPPELAANQDQETKRNLLRTATSVFDPLGGLTPFTVRAKRMFQSLWQTELNELPCIAMPRAYFQFSPTEASRLELYGFGDASEAAYAAVVYLRAVKTPDDVQVSFVTAKSRVAPLKKLSTLRLELMAALLCARLVCYVRKELALDVEACHAGVTARVREIQVLTLSLWWRYIPTEDNPADLASGGCTVKNLSTSLKWWQGPTWLRGPPETWPEAEREERIESLELLEKERRATAVLVTVSPSQDAANVINLGRYSSFDRTGTGLTSDELKEAERVWIRQEQIHAFGSKESLDKAMTKMLCGLNPFLDEFGVLQVGGRLGRAQLEEETKFPALLPRKGMIVDLLIRREHNRQLHAGVAQTLTALRERFWILRGRSAVKRVIRTVNPARPFSNVGIDFVGPLLIRSESSKYVSKKAYIFLFTCMVIRAIHLELVPDQTIDSFLRALRRFVARRGRPDTIQSDNFRTFHQANAFLKHLFSGRNWETVQRHLASERVEWIFITERSPWCGGYWEPLVRSVKTALKATLGQCLAAPDELRTVLCEIEARVNERPLTFVGSDVDEEMALTPAHFLISRSLASFPDRSNSADRGTLRSSLRHLLRRCPISRNSLRGKWKRLHEQPRVGDVVLVADYNTPRRRWPLGRIVELLTGDKSQDCSKHLVLIDTHAGGVCWNLFYGEPDGLYLSAGYALCCVLYCVGVLFIVCVVVYHYTVEFCPFMIELPVARVEPTFPFGHAGLDFAGPLHVRDEDRGVRKVYICLFTCMVTRAVHIEIVADMTTRSFLTAFLRFQADAFIRLRFVGKRAEQFQKELACRCIQWRYTTERAPWSGGYWERLVRSVKNALRKVLERSLLRFDELRTTLCELEARINNRPLTLLSKNPKDCAPLTPAHFLIGRELAALPTSSAETPSGTGGRHLGRRWRHQQLLMRHLGKRWTEEYLVSHSVRGKWKKIDRQPEVDDLVLVTEDTVPRNRWKLEAGSFYRTPARESASATVNDAFCGRDDVISKEASKCE
ncbi:hypothetical protein T01_389 [Trichinella spiralis]|uniref:Integrase catalytic domain-containing protein n=1 Tax=Trichinella spiralis TaxID=6334 RepID=A0A0V1AQ00_TRISP|nr:hypothetical protein T01_389 [Trichinella spiralis]